MELREYLNLIKRWVWLIILLAIIGSPIAYFVTPDPVVTYIATTTVLVSQGNNSLPTAATIAQGQRLASTYAELMKTRPILEKVISNLQINVNPGALSGRISVELVEGTNLLRISVVDSDPQRAADITNEIVRVFIEDNQGRQAERYATSKQQIDQDLAATQADITEIQIQLYDLEANIDRLNTRIGLINQSETEGTLTSSQSAERDQLQTDVITTQADRDELAVKLEQLQSRYATLLKSAEDIRLLEAQAVDLMSVVETALPGSPRRTGANKLLAALQGAIGGIVLAIGIVVLSEYLRVTVKSSDEIEQVIGLPTLGLIGTMKGPKIPDKLVTATNSRSPIAEAYRVLRTNIEFAAGSDSMRTIVVTSSNPMEGKTTTAGNLAVTLAQSGKRVILVDTDLRRPSLHKLFQCPNARGVTTALLQGTNVSISDSLVATDVANLYLMPSGPLPPNPADILVTDRMMDLVRQLTNEADIVIFDSPPILAVTDGILLGRICDAMLLVVLAESTRLDSLKRAKDQINQSGTKLIGVVLNRLSSKSGQEYYQYYYSAGR